MSELREKIADKISWAILPAYLPTVLQDILSLIASSSVEGLEVVRKCDNCNGTGEVSWDEEGYSDSARCHVCHGTGEIVRKMTRGEMEKAFKDHIEWGEEVIKLPSGERVRVKK